MSDALQLGASAPQHLRRPTFAPLKPSKAKKVKEVPLPVREPEEEFTFRTLAEDYAAQRDLLFVPLGRSHDSGRPLFRVAKGVDGKGGITVYVGEEAVFAQEQDGSYRAVTLEEMAKRAGA